MTGRERLVAKSRGGEVDQPVTLAWPASSDASDASVVAPDRLATSLPSEDRAVLAEVVNPFGLALARDLDLNELLDQDPARGGEILDGLVQETRNTIAMALAAGADGVLYRLHGACPSHCSPMQYGGHYLERDRELLSEIADARLNVLFVVADEEPYLDFVSDLPAHFFGWDDRASGVSAVEGRAIRGGAVATFSPDGDLLLTSPLASVAQYLEPLPVETDLREKSSK